MLAFALLICTLFRYAESLASKFAKASVSPGFEEFKQKFNRAYKSGSPEERMRRALFEQANQFIQLHNSKPQRWVAAVNKLTDRTEQELEALRGYRRSARPQSSRSNTESLLSTAGYNVSSLPSQFSWKGKLKATTEIQDQHGCGSCWAFAASTVLRAHSELFQTDRTFSHQQIVACAPNPDKCGGAGGCAGATAELAMDYVAKMGCKSEDELMYSSGYSGKTGECPAGLEQELDDIHGSPDSFDVRLQASYGQGGVSFGMTGYRRLPENQLESLLVALYQQGPVAVSISVGSAWSYYDSGILDTCVEDAVIDHAVTMLGWGEDNADKYWLIQNSWGADWGENGFIRILRGSHQEESAFCGWDREPEIGSGCIGGPAEVYVCGHCGVLYDMVVPTFDLAEGSWWHRTGRHFTVADVN